MEPAGEVWDYWVVWDVDSDTTEIPEGWVPASTDAVEGQNDYGEGGYGGPNPTDREHTYRFELDALDTALDLSPGVTADDVRTAAEGSIVESTTLTGTYAPSRPGRPWIVVRLDPAVT